MFSSVKEGNLLWTTVYSKICYRNELDIMSYVSIYIYIYISKLIKMQEFVYTPVGVYSIQINSNAFGHRFSSTSHHMSSRAIHLGNNILACLIHPCKSSADMSRHAAFIASRSDI